MEDRPEMEGKEKEELLKRFQADIETELSGSKSLDVKKVVDILEEIHGMNHEDRMYFQDFYLGLNQGFFDYGIKLKEYNPEIFNGEVSNDTQSGEGVLVKETGERATLEETIENLFEFIVEEEIRLGRRYIFFSAEYPSSDDVKILLLHQENSRMAAFVPIKGSFKEICEVRKLSDFVSEIGKVESNLIGIISFSYDSETKPQAIDSVKKIWDSIYSFSLLDFKVNDDGKVNSVSKINSWQEIEPELKSIISVELSNRRIDYSQEKILKRLFVRSGCYALEYELISGGFSGSKVFEIQPFTRLARNPFKSVVKVNQRNNHKLEQELENFNHFVKFHDNRYSIDQEKSDELIAIRYNYASSDSKSPSRPFSDCLEKLADKEHNYSEQLVEIIEKLFRIKLFQSWGPSDESIVEVRDLYLDYVKPENILPVIQKIRNQSQAQIIESSFIQNFNTIYSFPGEFKTKICHGDLHTGNFFIEEQTENEIFLIDFGDTGIKHCLIDHVTLECSLKFKHIPRYIPIGKILEVEKRFLEVNSFSPEMDLSWIDRPELIPIFKMINKIRQSADSLLNSKLGKLEYYIALLMLTFRQIQYDDLHQLYALESAENLTDFIMGELTN